MTIAGVHDTTARHSIQGLCLDQYPDWESVSTRQRCRVQSAECIIEITRGDTSCLCLAPVCRNIVTWSPVSEIIFIFCLLVSVDCDVRRGHRWPVSLVCPEPVVSGLNFIRYSTGNQDTAPAASSWDPSDHQTVGGLFSFIIFLKMEERI